MNHVAIPPQWSIPKFSFLQRVRFNNENIYRSTTEETGTITGIEYQLGLGWSELKHGWWYHIELDEDSPGWQPHSTEIRHEDELTLLEQEEVA